MGNDALNKMAQDMQIKRYNNELLANYVGRIIYSALCHWMRYSVMDETTSKCDRKSKAYILSRMRELLYIMSEAFPICKKWIFKDLKNPSDIDELVRELREKMLAARELLEIDSSHNIGLPVYKRYYCSQVYDRIVGLSDAPCVSKHIGITRVIRREQDSESNVIMNEISIEEYLDRAFGSGTWNECHSLEDFEFFNPYSKRPPYQSWTNAIPNHDKRMLARLTLYNGLHEYHLICRQQNKIMNSPLSYVLADWKEERRVLLALRKQVGNPMEATYEIRDSVCLLNLYCGLPTREQSIIDTYCWPLNSMDDKYNYVVPDFVWEDIKKLIVDNLGIELKEKN